MKTPVRVLLVGATGRMGQAIARCRAKARLSWRSSPGSIRAMTSQGALPGCDVVIDFSHADATER